jgi:uncharacterized protein (TIGR02594 family)
MARYNFEELREEYQGHFDECKVLKRREAALDKIIERMEGDRERYAYLEDRLGIPWYFIALIHERESSGRFDRHLHNGDPLTAPTVNYPPNRPPDGGPDFTWEESAEDALKLKDLDEWQEWNVPGMLYQLEKYNGFGYRRYEVPSPYLWSFTSLYEGGKYVRDHVFDQEAMDKQAGTAALLRRLVDLQKDYVQENLCPEEVTPPPPPPDPTKPVTYVVQAGDTLVKIAKKFGLPSWRVLWQANKKKVSNPNLIKVNQKLIIPIRQEAGEGGPPPGPEMVDYVMRQGDSLLQIANVCGISITELFKLNPELIKPGTVIKVPRKGDEDISIHSILVPGQEPLWLEIAEREEQQGVMEDAEGDNPRIMEYLRTTTYGSSLHEEGTLHDEVHWCAAFVNWCVDQANLKPLGSARARDWADWGVELEEPILGCLVVFPHHVGFFIEWDGDRIRLLGGNQSDEVNTLPFNIGNVLSYRWPEEVPVPA